MVSVGFFRRLTSAATFSTACYGGISLHGWAYETTPGVPIVAGAVPEPMAVSLFAVGSAFVVLAARRAAKSPQNGRHFVCEKKS